MSDTQKPSRLDKANPTGRVDVAAARALRGVVVSVADNPIAQILYKVVRPEIEAALTQELGPNSRTGKKVRREIQRASRIREEIARRLQEEL